ncbi:MAG TPA: hypothetical protein VIV54_07210 [Burkholderiales bacterium]
MADIRRLARVAGKALAAIVVGAALAACRSGGVSPAALPHPFLIPTGAYNGGRVPSGGFQVFVAPVAVAIHETDLFVADAGLNGLFRLDTSTLALRRLSNVAARTGMRLKALGDGTLYVLDPFARELLHLARDGRVLERLRDDNLLAGVTDFALQEPPGRLVLVDRGRHRVLVVSRTLGAVVEMIVQRDERLVLQAPWSIATAPGEAYIVDRARRQVARLDESGAVRQNFGALELKLPDTIAIDRYRRAFVREAADESLQVFIDGKHLARLASGDLLVSRVIDFAVLESSLVVVGAPGEALRVFRLRAPRGQP